MDAGAGCPGIHGWGGRKVCTTRFDWQGDTVYHETVLLLSEHGEAAKGQLLF